MARLGWLLCLLLAGALHAAPGHRENGRESGRESGLERARPSQGMPSGADAVRPFVAGSLARVLANRAGKPFILGFWSLDCVHCGEEMKRLKALKQRHPGLDLVLVSTDGEIEPATLAAHLQAAGLGRAEQWVFADPVPERLRQEIDKRWYGELPRTYLYGRDGQVSAVSGLLNDDVLAPWLKRNLAP